MALYRASRSNEEVSLALTIVSEVATYGQAASHRIIQKESLFLCRGTPTTPSHTWIGCCPRLGILQIPLRSSTSRLPHPAPDGGAEPETRRAQQHLRLERPRYLEDQHRTALPLGDTPPPRNSWSFEPDWRCWTPELEQEAAVATHVEGGTDSLHC